MEHRRSIGETDGGGLSSGIAPVLAERLEGIRKRLAALPDSGKSMTAPTKGQERELFIRDCLSLMLPPGVRFGTGEIVDTWGNTSGQMDIVLEFPFFPSLALAEQGPRLCFAEGVGAVIEVKSDIQKDWSSAVSQAQQVRKLKRRFEPRGFAPYGPPADCIPFFAVGYTGWKDAEAVITQLADKPVTGVFIVDSGLFVSGQAVTHVFQKQGEWQNSNLWGIEEYSLLCFVFALHRAMTAVIANSASLLSYARHDFMGSK